jgi:hypothetical protein
VIGLMRNCSVIPEGPHQRFHIISMDWFKLWNQFTSSQSGEVPGPINTDSQLKLIAVA